jgi:hypothetical protein
VQPLRLFEREEAQHHRAEIEQIPRDIENDHSHAALEHIPAEEQKAQRAQQRDAELVSEKFQHQYGGRKPHGYAVAAKLHHLRGLPARLQRRDGAVKQAEHGRQEAFGKGVLQPHVFRRELEHQRIEKIVEQHAAYRGQEPPWVDIVHDVREVARIGIEQREQRQHRNRQQHGQDLFPQPSFHTIPPNTLNTTMRAANRATLGNYLCLFLIILQNRRQNQETFTCGILARARDYGVYWSGGVNIGAAGFIFL